MRKIYVDFKEIEIKDIKIFDERRIGKYERMVKFMEARIAAVGCIRHPIEVMEYNGEYKIYAGLATYLAAKNLGYNKIPCLIRDAKIEVVLRRKMNRILLGEDISEEFLFNNFLDSIQN